MSQGIVTGHCHMDLSQAYTQSTTKSRDSVGEYIRFTFSRTWNSKTSVVQTFFQLFEPQLDLSTVIF